MTDQRRLAAIVSADVACYSRLMGSDESGTLAKALRREIVQPPINAHGGRIVKTTSDGFVSGFDCPPKTSYKHRTPRRQKTAPKQWATSSVLIWRSQELWRQTA